MAINLKNYNADIHSIVPLPLCLSIQTENKTHDTDEDDRRVFQDTVPLDDDDDLIYDQPANLDLETQVLYDSDYDHLGADNPGFEHEEEIVLDSEDEEINGSRVVIVTKSSRGTVTERTIKASPLNKNSDRKQLYNGNGVLLTGSVNEINLRDPHECDRKIATSNRNISIRGTEERSQAEAFGFVDHFVSTNKVDLSQEIGERKSFWQRSPTLLGSNGHQNLARKIYMRAQAKGHGRFEWTDHEGIENSREDVKLISDFVGCERNVVPYLNEKTMPGLNHLDSGFAANNAKKRSKVNEVSEANTVVEDRGIVRDDLDVYGIGFNTQLAAEAIEALAYANPFGFAEKTFDCTEIDSHPEHNKDIGEVLHGAKRKKRSERMIRRGISSSSEKKPGPREIDLDVTTMRSTERSKSPHKPIEQVLAIPLKTVETSLLGNIQSKGQFDKVYSRKRRRGQSSSDVFSKTVGDQANGHREKMNVNVENGIFVYRRKRSRVNANSLLGTTGGQKFSGLCGSGEESSNRILSSFSKLDMWNYPKGKRSKSNVRRHSNGTYGLNDPKNSHFQEKTMSKERSPSSRESLLGKSFDKLEASIVSADKIIKNSIPKTSLLNKVSMRKRKDIADVCLLLSQHLDIDIIKHQKKVASRLGISVVTCCTDATHFVADEFARTKNMLEAIALGKPVVTSQWLESCRQANCFIDERNYVLRDTKKEKEIGFSMPSSLARANQHPLLKGQRVLVTPNVKPDKEMIMNLVEAVNGQLVKDKDATEDLLILSCEEDRRICQTFLLQGVAVYSSELLLNGIVTQKLEYKRHRLFANDVKKTWSKNIIEQH